MRRAPSPAAAGGVPGRPAPLRPRLPRIAAAAGALALALLACRSPAPEAGPGAPAAAPGLWLHEHTRELMGTRFRILVDADPEEQGAGEGFGGTAVTRATEAAFARVEALERALSDWDPASELRRLGALTEPGAGAEPSEAVGRFEPVGPVPVSEDLFRVLELALEVGRLSGGAFDPTVGPLVRLWRRAQRQGEPPDPERLARAARSVGLEHVELDPSARAVRLCAPSMRLDLGGIAKGDAAEQALAVLRAHGFPRALVDAGGDLALGDPPRGRSAWIVALPPMEGAPDQAGLALSNVSVATSGGSRRSVELGGVRYSHLLDPRTGRLLPEDLEVTVLAPGGALADGLASAVSVLGAERGLALVESLPGVEARVVRWVGEEPRACDSSGLASRMASPGFGPPVPRPDPPDSAAR